MDAFSDLVSTEWLAVRLGAPEIRVLDATWYMPAAGVDSRRQFEEAHIPGADFFDIDEVANLERGLPHMLPSALRFAQEASRLGISNGHHVVVYDAHGLMSAPRVWWTFRFFGHDRVSVLDGGLPKWTREGRPLAGEQPQPKPLAGFVADPRSKLLADSAGVRAAIDAAGGTVIDARSARRFCGLDPEPRRGLRGGHIPHSSNVPYTSLLDTSDGTMLPPEALAAIFLTSGVDPSAPAICTCGSGITACVVALALHRVGNRDVAVYDGSWAEWAADPALPVAAS